MKKKNNRHSVRDVLSTSIGTGIVGLSAEKAVRGLVNAKTNNLTHKNIKDMYKKIGGKHNLIIFSGQKDRSFKAGKDDMIMFRDINNPIGSFYGHLGKNKFIRTSENAPIGVVAHEMGHSMSKFLNHKYGEPIYKVSKSSTALMPLASAYRLSKAYEKGLSKKERDKIKTQDDIASAVTAAPMLGEETFANVKALQALSRTEGINKRNILPVLGSELSYLTASMSTPIGHKIVDFLHRNDKH